MSQREILFRARRLDNGEWVEGDAIHYRDGDIRILPQNNGEWDIQEGAYEVDPSTLSQFTGLYDKVKNRVWEWDRYRHLDGTEFVIKWEESLCAFRAFYDEDGSTGTGILLLKVACDRGNATRLGSVHDGEGTE